MAGRDTHNPVQKPVLCWGADPYSVRGACVNCGHPHALLHCTACGVCERCGGAYFKQLSAPAPVMRSTAVAAPSRAVAAPQPLDDPWEAVAAAN